MTECGNWYVLVSNDDPNKEIYYCKGCNYPGWRTGVDGRIVHMEPKMIELVVKLIKAPPSLAKLLKGSQE